MRRLDHLATPVVLLLMLCSLVLPAGIAQANQVLPHDSGRPFNPATTSSDTAAIDNTLQQFTSAGHVLAFGSQSLYLAGLDHALRVEFVGGRAVQPIATAGGTEKNGVAPLGTVCYSNVWDNIDVKYSAVAGGIAESTYTIHPGGNPADISLRYNGPVNIEQDGGLRFHFESGYMTESAPIAWQEIDGQRKPVAVSFILCAEREVGFSLGDYVPGVSVVIDPTLIWNTFLGGGGTDRGHCIAMDGSGNVYVAGFSSATWGSPRRAYSGSNDAFVAKLDSSGNLIWNTFLGGEQGTDEGYGIAVDGSGDVYVAGYSSQSWVPPVVYCSDPDDPDTCEWDESTLVYNDAFAAKLDGNGNLSWYTYLGGGGGDNGTDKGYGIAVDGSGNVYVAGTSTASWGTPRRSPIGVYNAFAAKLDGSGTLIWNTFLGGIQGNEGYGIAVDGSGDVYVAGFSHFPWGTPVRAFGGVLSEAFAARLNGNSGDLIWNTFLGGNGWDRAHAIAVDGSGKVYVTGYSEFTWGTPVQPLTLHDAFAAKLDGSGNLIWNTFLGGNAASVPSPWDQGNGIAVDSSGNVYVAGYSNATWGSPKRPYAGGPDDAFAAKLDGSGVYQSHTFLGGTGTDRGRGIAVDSSGNAYVAGYSSTTWGSPVRAYSGSNDAFVARVSGEAPTDSTPPTTTCSQNPPANANGWNNTNVTVSLTAVDNQGGSGVKEIRYSVNGGAETIVSGATASFALSADGTYNISYYAKDNTGNTEAAKSYTVKIDKTPPTITASRTPGANANGWNNTDVVVHFGASDTLSGIDIDTVTPDATISTEGADQSVTGTATDKAGNSASATVAGISIDKTVPTVTVTIPTDWGLCTVGTALQFSATDPLSNVSSVLGTLTNTFAESQQVPNGFQPTAHVYTLVVRAIDKADNASESAPVNFVVYDPQGGFATGGGWFTPDAESTLPGGRANFGFVAKYKSGASTGNLEFQCKDANINLKSTSIDWLTISGVSAQFQGRGTINGQGLYTFRTRATDNAEPGVGADHFDIKIWEGTNTDADPIHKAKNTLQGGNIVVHKK